jgi:ribonucleoside-diphosphate reductase alpha subunit
MFVIKRDGKRVSLEANSVHRRITKAAMGLKVDANSFATSVVTGLCSEITTRDVDNLIAESSFALTTHNLDYEMLATRIAITSLHKSTPDSFIQLSRKLAVNVAPKTGLPAPLLSPEYMEFVERNAPSLEAVLNHERDFDFTYFGFKRLEKSYLWRIKREVAERPQHMWMRVAVALHLGDLDAVLNTYQMLSLGLVSHASPTLFSAGMPNQQLSSCFLLMMQADSITGIYATLAQTAEISQRGGGIGIAISHIRTKGSYIRGSTGESNGIIPMLRVFNNTSRYVDQGGGKRKGAFAVYLEPWHAEILGFLDLRKNGGTEESRCHDLFPGLWIPDLFMQRVEEDGDWSLFCPNEALGLSDCYGDEFVKLYNQYEAQPKLARWTGKARKIWSAIVETQPATGGPYMLYKDACNRKSNQRNLGTIRCSNLCTEIIEYTSEHEIAVCNLASVVLPKCIINGRFNLNVLAVRTQALTRNLNRVLDVTKCPVPQATFSNQRRRAIGIGMQGLADTFLALRLPYGCEQARQLNRDIAETMYFAACTESMKLARESGLTYEGYEGSPMSEGKFQFDLWGVAPSELYDWETLRKDILRYGVRNSQLIALMPTVSTAQMWGNSECFEPYPSHMLVRRTIAGEHICITKQLVSDLQKLGLWSDEMRQRIMANNGSIQEIEEIPEDIRELYLTAWEISCRTTIDMAADRGPFVCQSQSLSHYMPQPDIASLTSMHFYAWKKGLKTGMYYLHVQPAAEAIKFTVDHVYTKKPHDMMSMGPSSPSEASSASGETMGPSSSPNSSASALSIPSQAGDSAPPAKRYRCAGDVCDSCGA